MCQPSHVSRGQIFVEFIAKTRFNDAALSIWNPDGNEIYTLRDHSRTSLHDVVSLYISYVPVVLSDADVGYNAVDGHAMIKLEINTGAR